MTENKKMKIAETVPAIELYIVKAPYYVYILETISKKNRKTFYTGYTHNLRRRIILHKTGRGAKHCKGKKVRLLYYETFKTRKKAMHREQEIKNFSKQKKKELIQRFKVKLYGLSEDMEDFLYEQEDHYNHSPHRFYTSFYRNCVKKQVNGHDLTDKQLEIVKREYNKVKNERMREFTEGK